MVEAVLAYTIKAIDEASSTMDKIKSSVGLLGGAFTGLGGPMAAAGQVMTGFAAGGPAGAVIAAGGEVAGALQQAVGTAADSEQAFKDLGIAVDKSGTAWDSVKDGTKTALDSMSHLTKYSNIDLAGALQRLLSYGLSYNDAIAALGPTTDFATAKQMDLTSAATIVGKGMDGNVAILKRYGVEVESSKDALAALKEAHDKAAIAVKALGSGTDAWVTSVSAAIGADSSFEAGLGGAKDKAGYLVDQLNAGNINLSQFTQAMTSLGVPLDDAALKGGSAAAVIEKLNEQFGGTAQESAKTYEGTQERLAHAWEDLSVKVGNFLLPALTKLNDALVPIVDGLGKAVDGFGTWLDQMGKMPEVQGAVEGIQKAFSGFYEIAQKNWNTLVNDLGPALKELFDALGELWKAIQPVFGAFGELWDAMTGGTGNLDLFKTMIDGVVTVIRGWVEIIKAVTPIIKTFADDLKTAADILTPVLKQIHDAIAGFLDGLKTLFQGFYNWLVGASLWTDMWNQMLTIASEMIGQLISDLGSKLFDPLKNAFTGALEGLKELWSKGWDAIQTAGKTVWNTIAENLTPWMAGIKTTITDKMDSLNTAWETDWRNIKTSAQTAWDIMKMNVGTWIDDVKTKVSDTTGALKTTWDTNWAAVKTTLDTLLPQVQTFLNTKFDEMKGYIEKSTGTYGPTMTSALSGMQAAMNAGFALVHGDWKGALNQMSTALTDWGTAAKGILDGIMGNLKGAVDAGIQAIEGGFTGLITSAQGAIGQAQGLFQQAQSAVNNVAGQISSAAQTGGSNVTNVFQQAYNAVANGAQWLYDTLVGHSVWTDLIETMQAQTYSAVGNIADAFGHMSVTIPSTLAYSPAATSTPAPSQVPTPSAAAPGSFTFTIPITVTLDGQMISRQVETRIVRRASLRSNKVA
jgi:phage-related protein